MMYRLPSLPGEWIDRTQTRAFTFEGQRYEGFAGDTITSALAAGGVMVLGRSFKYHRPRGILSFANHDVNALFQVGGLPNVRGDVVALAADMNIAAVNTFGGLAHDRARWMDRLSRFLPVGFYYKAFNSKRLFPYWEKLIRRLSGLGTVPLDAPHVRTPKRYAFCDVLVIGGGTGGMSAALSAADAGANVLLVDENARLGGAPEFSRDGNASVRDDLRARVHEHSRIEVICSSYAAGIYTDHWIALVEPHRMTKVRARAIVLASGAIEQPVVFRNNDLPGVLLASAAQRLLSRHAVAVGKQVVVVTLTRSGYETALELVNHRILVTHLIDPRPPGADGDLAEIIKARGVVVLSKHHIVEAHAGTDGCLQSISVGSGPFADMRLECDALLMNGGWAPASQLLLQAGGKVEFDEAAQMHLPVELPEGFFVAGRVSGVFDVEAGIAAGIRAGQVAARHSVHGATAGASVPSPVPRGKDRMGASTPFTISADPRGKDFIDFDEDLQVKDLENAAQEGFDSIELLKRYTTVGMGPSQGKHSNINAARVLARLRGLPLNEIGLTTARPMYHPVPMKHLAGRGFTPDRVTPIEARHRESDAVWMLAGNWRRPAYYARSNETREQCIASEVAAVRHAVGLIDVGTLGKIEVHGPDAGLFLDRTYCGRYSDLRPGMTRYALLLDESGTIVDDGVVARVHANCFYFTTTTGGSATVYRELLRLNALWGLNCALVNVTGHRAAFNLAGPRSRAVLSRLTSADLSDRGFPYLGVRETLVAGVHARLLRVGFVGELGYEIHVPYSAATSVWDALVNAGANDGLRLFGVEAQRTLRLEKGHFIIGQDTDGLTNPFEAQAGWAVKMQKPFFVGQRSLRILEKRGPRQLLIGFETVGRVPALKECHLVIEGDSIAGRVTSVTYSSELGKTIGLAMVNPGLASIGTKLAFRLTDGGLIEATVCPTPFYDRDNQRQKFEEAA
jgi:sarcosine oxidase subunit alpha